MATDWMAQAQAEVDRWVEAQRAWWAQVAAGPGAGGPQDKGTADPVRAAVDAWREAAYRAVDAQAQALLAVLGSASAPSDAQQLLGTWTDAQRKMWQDWLAVAGGASPPVGEDDPGRRLVESLREAAEHLVRSQADWANAWSAAETPPEGRGGP